MVQAEHTGSKVAQLMQVELRMSRVNPTEQTWQFVELHKEHDPWYAEHVMHALEVAFTMYPVWQLEQLVSVQV